VTSGPPGPPIGGPPVRLRAASVGYADRAVVQAVDLTVEAGDVLALLGPNGSGKTTLIRGILGLARVLGGSLELFGVPHERFHDRGRIGYVPQRHTVAGTVPSTVREVVSSGRLPLRRPFVPANARDRASVEDAIATVGLADRAGSNLAELSGGQQRRVLIARALASQPDLLVMDEPTAGVDAASQEQLGRTLATLAGSGVTMVIATHDADALAGLLTRAVVVREGHKTYDGPPDPRAVPLYDGAHHHLSELAEVPQNPLGITGWGATQ
jgi:zinc transport system ATP-binding protein